MSYTFKIITLGCKVNHYESACLGEALCHLGWNQTGKGKGADVAIINTCVVTQKAAHQSRQAIHKAVRENPNALIACVGCYAQVFPDELSRIPGVGLIAGNTEKGKIPGLLVSTTGSKRPRIVSNAFGSGMPFEQLRLKRFLNRTRAYLKIQDGCQSFCSYCIVPFARGPYRSMPLEEVLEMLRSLTDEGYKEIVLTGIHLGKYGADLAGGVNLTGLLRAIGKERHSARIRLSSIEPNEIDMDLIEMVASEDWLCRHFHIPLQSGDNSILKRMNRHYTPQGFARLIERIYHRIPLAAIGVDVMSGFPGEDASAHKNTYSLIRDLPVSYLHVFPFSPRPGTPASEFEGQNGPEVIKTRAKALRELGYSKKATFYRACLKKEFQVLSERRHSGRIQMMRGMSDNYLPVVFPFAQYCQNQFVAVRVEKMEKDKVIGSATAPAVCPS